MLFDKFLIKKIAPIPKLFGHKKYLFISPHPDDVEFAAPGTAARLCAEGAEVYYLVCADGRYGTSDKELSPDDLVLIRQKEQLKAAELFGVKEVKFLPFVDGGMYDKDELKVEILKEISRIEPDVIFCPDPNLSTEFHADHIKVAQAATEAFMICPIWHFMKSIGCESAPEVQVLALYYTHEPNTYVDITKYNHMVEKGLRCFPSQFRDEEDFKYNIDYLHLQSRIRGLRSFKGRAEGFKVLGYKHIHTFLEL